MNTNKLMAHGSWLMALLIGCAEAPDGKELLEPTRTIAHHSGHQHSGFTSREQVVLETRDLGKILSDGQTITQDFEISNSGEDPLRLLTVEALTPCCSRVEEFPETIAPDSSGIVRVSMSPGFQSGPKQISYSVRTDSADHPHRLLRIEVELVSAWTVTPGAGATSLVLGQAGEQHILLTAVRGVDSGRSLPDHISISAPLRISYSEPTESLVDANGLTYSHSEITVEIPASSELGTKRNSIEFEWDDGRRASWPILWKVTPTVIVHPDALSLDASPAPVRRTVVIRADRPFRIIQVDGARVVSEVPLPTLQRSSHALILEIDASEAVFRDILVATDHPDQAEVSISLQVRPRSRNNNEKSLSK
ncbi:hypothetical protein BH23PLA1_BH23PLA1_07160 [soil metagenome]